MRTGYYWLGGALLLIVIFVVSGFGEEEEQVPQNSPLPLAGSECVIDGYAEYFSAFQGERLKFYLNFKFNADITLRLVDVREIVVDSVNFFGYIQRKPSDEAYVEGFGYKRSFTYHIPRYLKSGLYHWSGTEIWFLVKEKSAASPIVIVYPSNTEQAYNNAGGKSLYDFNSTDGRRAYTVSSQRPINYRVTLTSDIHVFTTGFLGWLLDTDYEYRLIADADMENKEAIRNAKVVVVIGHSEYWSRTARATLDSFNLQGGNVAIFSGNTMWW